MSSRHEWVWLASGVVSQEGLNLEPLFVVKPPLTGWEVLDKETIPQLCSKIPKVSHGTMYEYL